LATFPRWRIGVVALVHVVIIALRLGIATLRLGIAALARRDCTRGLSLMYLLTAKFSRMQ
jgi:hypothetical protein